MTKVYFHVDLDAFFASVEQLDHPEYRGKPLIVGGEIGGRRSVVSTASYEARKFGVHSAMPVYQAVKLCPQGIFISGNMRRYQEKSREVMWIFYDYSPDVQQMSVDEAFIDMTGTEKLFGPPVEAAKKLKAEIREKTGLTVSVGIASTKYCAKIASGLQKPDGLYEVKPGSETEFMLSLPLEKLWGAGKKTQEKLKSKGIFTTRDIYNRSPQILQSMFGNASGIFLYNAVRGNEYEDFNSEPKSRSISAESTYEYDLSDSDSMETALLELCHTVMFRSLKEKVRSKSISLKIRYEDFSTVSIQETSERYISSVDDLFERARNLFYKKYRGNLGIRLFGVSMQNLEDDTKPREPELFDFGDENKRKIEQAILKAEQKNPSIKITKARLLQKGVKLLLLFLTFFTAEKTYSQASETVRNADGAGSITFDTTQLPLESSDEPLSIFKKDFSAGEVEFLAEGFWSTSISTGADASFGFGTTPGFSFSTPVFSQNVDLSLWFMVNNQWYFEAGFADQFEKNTIAAGYKGDGILREARIGNRGIKFPTDYSIDEFNRGLGGGENQAPGISMNWQGEKWKGDFVIRYDQLSFNSKTWYGKNSVTENSISISDYLTGSEYILPDLKILQKIKAVYVEAPDGNYRDSRGRKYNRLNSTQYLLSGSRNSILFSKDSKASRKNGTLPAVAVSFYDESAEGFKAPYSAEFQEFLAQTEQAFDGTDLSVFYYDFTSTMKKDSESETILYLQHPAGFSPFQNASRYDGGTLSIDDAAVTKPYSDAEAEGYRAVISEEDINFAQTDFFYKNHSYIDIVRTDSDSSSPLNAELRFPFAKNNPSAYLNSGKVSDLEIKVKTYSPVTRLDIGTKAVAGTVQVYKNSILDSGASYDSETGTISLSTSVQATDRIYAVWQEESEAPELSSFAMGAGYRYDFSEKLTADASFSSRISYSDRKFSDDSKTSPLWGTLAAGIKYKNSVFEVKNSSAITVESLDSTGNHRILGMDDTSSDTIYLSKNAEIDLPEEITPFLKLKDGSAISLKSGANRMLPSEKGYAVSGISGYAVPMSWKFEDSSGEWAAQTVSLASASLAASSAFEIALKNPTPEISDFDVYLQLGVSSDEDFEYEDSEVIPCWKITDSTQKNVEKAFNTSLSLDTNNNGWQTVKVILSDSDRAFIANSKNQCARLVILPKNDTVSSLNESSTILAGPYQCDSSSFITDCPSYISLTSTETRDTTLVASKIRDFNGNSDNKVQAFEWKYTDTPTVDDAVLTFQKYFPQTDFSNYRELCFWIKSDGHSDINFTMDSFSKKTSGKAVEFSIPSEILSNAAEKWLKVSLDLASKKVQVNGKTLQAIADTDVIPERLLISVLDKNPQKGTRGFLYIDELHLSGTAASVTIQDKLNFLLEKKEPILSTNGFALVKDVKISATGNGASRLKNHISATKNTVSGEGEVAATIAGLKIFLSGGKDSETKDKDRLSTAAHSIETASPILNSLKFSENYSFNSPSRQLEKSNSAELNLSRLHLPLTFNFNSHSEKNDSACKQNFEAGTNLNIKAFSFSAKAAAKQNFKESDEVSDDMNYFSSWKKISEIEFSRGEKSATSRTVSLNSKIESSFKPLNFKPSISFETKGAFKSRENGEFRDETTTALQLPFTIRNNLMNFRYSRSTGSTTSISTGENYIDDSQMLGKEIRRKDFFIKTLPVQDLITDRLAGKIQEISSEQASGLVNYSALYEFNWKRPFYGSKYDLFIPQSASFGFSRDIRAEDSVSDFYQLKQTLNFSAMNIFGTKGIISLFDFYEQDEFITSLSAALKIPRNEAKNTSILINGYSQIKFIINSTDTLKTALEGSFETSSDWDIKTTVIWKRNSDNSLASGIYSLFKKNTTTKPKITITDSLNAAASESTSSSKIEKKYSLDFTHKTDTEISRYVTINTGAGLGYYAQWNHIAKINGTLTLGATVRF